MQGNGIELSALDVKSGADAGFKINLLHPADRKPIGAWIEVFGSDSDMYVLAGREIQRERDELLKRGQRKILSEDEADELTIRLLARVTRSWSDNMLLDGTLLVFSTENAVRLYSEKRLPWIREQVAGGIHNRANFLPGNGTSS